MVYYANGLEKPLNLIFQQLFLQNGTHSPQLQQGKTLALHMSFPYGWYSKAVVNHI